MPLLRNVVIALALFGSGSVALAASPEFIALPYLCDTATSGAFQPAPRDPNVMPGVYHQVLTWRPSTQAWLCHSGEVTLPDVPELRRSCRSTGHLGETFAQLRLWAVDVVCRGGVMSAAQMTLHTPLDRDSLGTWSLDSGAAVLTLGRAPYTRFVMPRPFGAIDPYGSSGERQTPYIDARILNPRIPVSGIPPASERPSPPLSYQATPAVQITLALLASLYAGLAFFGRYHNPSGPFNPNRPIFSGLLIVSLLGLALSAYFLRPYIDTTYTQAFEMVERIKADQAQLSSLITVHNGMIEPFTPLAYRSAMTLMTEHTIPNTTTLYTDALFRAGVSLAPLVFFFLLFIPYAIAGWYHLFVKPPIEKTLKPALASGGPIDTKAAAAVLKPDITEARNPPPAYQSDSQAIHLKDLADRTEHQAAEFAERAARTADHKRSLVSKLNVTGRLMQAINRRESKRRELEEEERLVRETEQRLAKQDETA